MNNRNLPLKIAAVFLMVSFGSVKAQDFKSIIQNQLSSKSTFMKGDLSDFEIINEDFSKSMNTNVIKFQQSLNGIPVYNAVGTALIGKDAKVAFFNESFSKDYKSVTKSTVAESSNTIFESVAKTLDLKDGGDYKILKFSDSDLDKDPFVKSKLVYFQTENNDLKLCYEFAFEDKETLIGWTVIADAVTGEILSKEKRTLSCSFNHDAYSRDSSEQHTPEGFTVNFAPNPKPEKKVESATAVPFAPLDASYRVFDLPLESPNHGARTLVENPWFTDASPDGWHSILGGKYVGNYTTSRGNNVMVYDDRLNINAPGEYLDGGALRFFDFPFAEGKSADIVRANSRAASTNLFYINNKIHDIFYRLGFTETARNFQAWNYEKGGAQEDYVQAEAQDGQSRNNANFSFTTDGTRPRMQMYLWDPKRVDRLFYNTPTEAVGRVVANGVASFGPTLTPDGTTGDVVLSPVLDACTELPAYSLQGKIGLIERGNCLFVEKVKNVQKAGAIAAVIYSLPDSAVQVGTMPGTDSTIRIPSMLVGNTEGVYMKELLAQSTPLNITLKFDTATQESLDGSFDNGIVIHEYGHGISNRLTGTGGNCLNKAQSIEQMGEGWSDIFALMLTNQPGDTAANPRGIGTYAKEDPITGPGIRPKRYSPDQAINDYTYKRTNGMGTNTEPDVHSIGFVWATMLWDLHWKYVDKYGYSSDVMAENKNNGSTRFLQLVVDGLKLQPCNPTFIDGRDAIIAADAATTGGVDKCMIWNTFASRGLGVNASAGSKTDINDQVEDFTVPEDCKLSTNDIAVDKVFSIYPNPAKNEFSLKSSKNILGKLNVEIYDASGKLVSNQKISSTEKVSTQALSNGIYVVKVTGLGIEYSSKLMIKK